MTRLSSSLDGIHRNRNTWCGRWSLEGHLQDRVHYARLGCKSWRCHRCGPRKARRVRRAIIDAASKKKLSRFLTLTLNPGSCAPDDSIGHIRRSWNKFRTYLKRRYLAPVSFIAVVELQHSGYAHLHVLIDRYIEQRWISEAWQAVGGGKIVDIRQIDIHRIGPYMSKYLTKALLLTHFKPRQRRYSTSRDINLFLKTTSGDWFLLKAPVEFIYSLMDRRIIREAHDEVGELEWFEVYAGSALFKMG